MDIGKAVAVNTAEVLEKAQRFDNIVMLLGSAGNGATIESVLARGVRAIQQNDAQEKEIARLRDLCLRWNKMAGWFAAGSEFVNDPERVLEALKVRRDMDLKIRDKLREQNNELKLKAEKYDQVVEQLHVADGGHWRQDTVDNVLWAARAVDKFIQARHEAVVIRDIKKAQAIGICAEALTGGYVAELTEEGGSFTVKYWSERIPKDFICKEAEAECKND